MVHHSYPRKLSLVMCVYLTICRNPEVYFQLEGGISSLWVSRVVNISKEDFSAARPSTPVSAFITHIRSGVVAGSALADQ